MRTLFAAHAIIRHKAHLASWHDRSSGLGRVEWKITYILKQQKLCIVLQHFTSMGVQHLANSIAFSHFKLSTIITIQANDSSHFQNCFIALPASATYIDDEWCRMKSGKSAKERHETVKHYLPQRLLYLLFCSHCVMVKNSAMITHFLCLNISTFMKCGKLRVVWCSVFVYLLVSCELWFRANLFSGSVCVR